MDATKIVLIILTAAAALLAGGAVALAILGKKKHYKAGYAQGQEDRKATAERTIGSAEEKAALLLREATATAERRRKETVLEAKDEIHRQRQEVEKDLRDRRTEVQRQENRINQRETTLDKRIEKIEKNEELLGDKIKTAETRLEEIERLKREEFSKLELISGYTAEQAKAELLGSLDRELEHEKSLRVADAKQRFEDESDALAKEIIATSVQRCAVDHAAEITTSVVPLPNDEMKGRIIGREGRNIRTLETITGVDLIIDDTPEAITLSCFDPVRREVARRTLETLILDGRIHPARVEELYEKCKRDVQLAVKQAGERALMETGVNAVHSEIIKLLGKLQFRTSYGQNVLKHSLEVSFIAGLIASELGTDVKAAKRAGLLHDIGKAIDHEQEGSHVSLGVEAARKYKESENIIHAIAAHHEDVEATTTLDVIIQAADAISAGRPGARRENTENYIKRLQKLEEVCKGFPGVESSFAMQAGREVRIMVKPENVSDDQMTLLARDIAKKIESDLDYPGQIKVHLIRESRVSELAK